MGDRDYKRTYEGDYSKSYKSFATWKQQGVDKKNYQSISKKINDKPYNKKEKGGSYNIGDRPKESERVNAAGSVDLKRRESEERKRDNQIKYKLKESTTNQNNYSYQQPQRIEYKGITINRAEDFDRVAEAQLKEDSYKEDSYASASYQEMIHAVDLPSDAETEIEEVSYAPTTYASQDYSSDTYGYQAPEIADYSQQGSYTSSTELEQSTPVEGITFKETIISEEPSIEKELPTDTYVKVEPQVPAYTEAKNTNKNVEEKEKFIPEEIAPAKPKNTFIPIEYFKTAEPAKKSEQRKPIVNQTAQTIEIEKPVIDNYSSFPTIEEPKPWTSAYEKDDDYSAYDYPITEVGFEEYNDAKTGKKIGLEEACIVLDKAGYIPKQNQNLGALLFIFILTNIFASVIAPFVAIGYGVWRYYLSNITVWQKFQNGKLYKYEMPVTESERAMNKRIGQISFVVGAISALIHFQQFF